MKNFEEPKMEVISFEIEDIITTSSEINPVEPNPGNELPNMPF